MKRHINKILGILSLSLLFTLGCEPMFNVNGEWKEITVVYGLLNQNDTAHYLKITKAFLGDADAMIMAQNPDSSNYHGELTVELEEWDNNYRRTIVFDTTTINQKDSGYFYYPSQIVYKAVSTLHPQYTYKLYIKNNITGKEIYAETPLVDDFSVTSPKYNPINPLIGFTNIHSSSIVWKSGENGRLYQQLVRFLYSEKDLGTGQTDTLYVDWVFPSIRSTGLEGGEELSNTYVGSSFYQSIANQILPRQDVERKPVGVNLQFYVAGDELSTYLDVNQSSSSIVLERPEYTNIEGGIGVLSCRYDKIYEYKLTSRSVDSLVNGAYTSNLSFVPVGP